MQTPVDILSATERVSYRIRATAIPDNKSKVIQFLNTEMRAKSQFSVKEEYPSLFCEYPGGESLYIEREGKIVSHVGFVDREFQHPLYRMKIGLLGSVVTAPQYRGQGFASTLLRQALVELKRRGCLAAMLWSENKDFYLPLGFFRGGREHDFRFSLQNLPEVSGVVRPLEFEKDAHIIWRLYQKHTCRLDRSLEEQKKLLRIPEAKVYVTEKEGQVTSYIAVNKGADFTDFIHEWGGDAQEVQRNIAYCQKNFFPANPLTLIAPAEYELPPIKQLAVEKWDGVLGLLRVLDRSLLLSHYVTFLKHKGVDSVWSKEKDRILLEQGEFAIKSDAEVVALVFGDETHTTHPVLPFFLWGYDSI